MIVIAMTTTATAISMITSMNCTTTKIVVGAKTEMRVNALETTFEEVTVFGIPMMFTCLRVDPQTVPKGLYLYEVRHDDNMQGIPCEIGNWILVNHWGTLLSNKPLRVEPNETGNNAYRQIDAELDWNYEGANITIEEYLNRHPIKQPRIQDLSR